MFHAKRCLHTCVTDLQKGPDANWEADIEVVRLKSRLRFAHTKLEEDAGNETLHVSPLKALAY